MRKPVVVVSAAAALLLGGGFLATSAAADERPDSPGWSSFWWPDLFGDEDSSDDQAGDDMAVDDAGGDEFSGDDAEPFSDRGAGEQPVLDDDGEEPGTPVGSDDGDAEPEEPVAGDDGDVEPDATVPGDDGDRRVEEPDAAQPDGYELPSPAAPRTPVQEKPQKPTQRKQAADVMVGARRAVTASDVSRSPSAPMQQRVLRLINQNRRHGGCRPFTLDRRLIEAANEHAADMARRDYFAHKSPNGEGAGDRVEEAGYRWKRYGENIARGADSAYEVVNGWMNSPSHRENILDCRLHEMGVGLAISRDRTPYWVQDFATPKS
ncbi:CAP domain-containing protein [Actinoplanes sp. Pm04-4]|uniref:CAP domain-containing protein n=1 Tax=Paractinoplanes pyxinae TaxID=2997416 RepID=A0ABT4B242_9ACTN|nr:CAP domain-containing protein [Actinoplanes pyxinae]MCY1139725.1 CAP domain-containing protein [Actinoplanes pyxinae]